MANKTYRDIRVKIDNAATTLTDVTAYLNSADMTRALDLIEDSGLSDTNRSYLFGLAGTTISLSGMVNSTTDGIWGPLVAAATSVTKTLEYRAYYTNSTGNVGRFYYGEVLISNVRYSGSVNSLQTFSADHTFDGAVTRSSTQTS